MKAFRLVILFSLFSHGSLARTEPDITAVAAGAGVGAGISGLTGGAVGFLTSTAWVYGAMEASGCETEGCETFGFMFIYGVPLATLLGAAGGALVGAAGGGALVAAVSGE